MENSFVIIGYDQDQQFISKIERGPFNRLTDFFYIKSEQKRLKKFLSKQTLQVLQPFSLESYDLEIEDVEGWEDPIFWKGRVAPQAFSDAFTQFKEVLPQLLSEEDWTFYQSPLAELSGDLEQLLHNSKIAYVTFYDLLV